MSIAENISEIENEKPKDVTLIAVSKTRDIAEIKQAVDFGIRDFGENKVQELLKKIDSFDSSIRWHLIGHLQRNKVKYIVGKVYLIQSLDSVELLKEIEKRYASKNLVAQTLIEINIGREESKTGIYEENLKELLDAAERCSNVKINGLMCVIPKGSYNENLEYFKKVKNIFETIKANKYTNITMKYLSMGMTHDYKTAIECGSNMIRVGEGIFGKRNYNK